MPIAFDNLSTKEGAEKGGYILSNGFKQIPDAIVISSGSEVGPCMQAQELLAQKGISVRVVSMPCMEVFDNQSAEYRETVLPKSVRARVAVEAGSKMPWGKYVGLDGDYVCIDQFGTSAPFTKLFDYYGFTSENIANTIEKVLANN